jgi:hypothetical protein
MKKGVLSFSVLAFALGIARVGVAHHPPKMERCISVTLTGQIERIEWRRPHVEVFIRTAEGVTHELSWLAINQLHLAQIYQDTLHIGDDVTIVAGIRPNEVVERPMLLSYIHRDVDDWGWSQKPQGC